VTHDQEEALALGDRVAALDRGVLRQIGPPAELLREPADRFVAGFLGWPPMSFVDGRLTCESDRWLFTGPGGSLPIPATWKAHAGRDLVLGLRAEHIRLPPDPDADVVLEMEARQIEPLGPDRLVTLTRGGWVVLAQCEGSLAPREQASATVSLDLSGAHLFDAATGRALSHGV
jgi:multiple sugar transport system ATP-binding protein